jgi:hypothetical protein
VRGVVLHDWKATAQHELSWFLIAYLLVFLSILMLIHLIQPDREGPRSLARSPVHQEQHDAK